MPTIGALVLASVAGILIRDWLGPLLGFSLTTLLSLVVSGLVYYFTRRWLLELRGE